MGFFGWVSSKIKQAKEFVSEKISEAKEFVKEKVTNIWNKFSGKGKFEEAERLYNEISERYQKKRKQFETDLESYTDKIEKHIETINRSKEKIKTELFLKMANKMEKIKDISVSEDFTIEAYKAAALSFDSIRSKSQLYKIDFNKHKFKTTVQAIFTLGFYTRKKARETLYAVQEEAAKLEAEMAKMDAELVKLKAIEESLANVEYYFTSLIELYENLLIRLDSSINYLYVRCLNLAHKLIHAEMSIRKLPKMQQKEVEAIITASKILKAMTDAQITSVEDSQDVSKYKEAMKQQHDELKKVYNAA